MSRQTPKTGSDAITRDELDISTSDLGLDPAGLLDNPGNCSAIPGDNEDVVGETGDMVPARSSSPRRPAGPSRAPRALPGID